VLVRLGGDEIVIVKVDKDLERRVEEWYASMKGRSVPAFTEEEEFEEPKWISDEYARRKLGLD